VQGLGSSPYVFLAAIAAHVGLDPVKDINWVIGADPSVKPIEQFAQGKIDAFLGLPPEPQERRPQYRACHCQQLGRSPRVAILLLHAGNREFVRDHPVATKRALRAILKGTDLCVTERVARQIVDGGFRGFGKPHAASSVRPKSPLDYRLSDKIATAILAPPRTAAVSSPSQPPLGQIPITIIVNRPTRPADSFLGGFRTPALRARGNSYHRPASETLH